MAVKRTVKKPLKRKSKKVSGKKLQRGTVGNFFVFGVLALLMVLGITAVGGLPSQNAPTSGQVVDVITPTPGQNYSNLQLKTFGYVTIAPTPTPAPGSLCANNSINTEPTILVAYYPGPGQTSSDFVKVWVDDENPPFIAPGEQIDSTTGAVTLAGDRGAKANDGYYYEPALYISPATAETGGAPHFPDMIKGNVNNDPNSFNGGFLGGKGIAGINGPAPDPLPVDAQTPREPEHKAEYIWNVANLGQPAGTYQAEFVVHDGDRDRGVGCVSITIQ
jgi:hypothetical protein